MYICVACIFMYVEKLPSVQFNEQVHRHKINAIVLLIPSRGNHFPFLPVKSNNRQNYEARYNHVNFLKGENFEI